MALTVGHIVLSHFLIINFKMLITSSTSTVFMMKVNLWDMYSNQFLCFSVWVQQEKHILCLQPCWHKDHLPQWRIRRLEWCSAGWCHPRTKEVNVCWVYFSIMAIWCEQLMVVCSQQHQTEWWEKPKLWRRSNGGPSRVFWWCQNNLHLFCYFWGRPPKLCGKLCVVVVCIC